MLKPVFVPKARRETALERARIEKEEKEKEHKRNIEKVTLQGKLGYLRRSQRGVVESGMFGVTGVDALSSRSESTPSLASPPCTRLPRLGRLCSNGYVSCMANLTRIEW